MIVLNHEVGYKTKQVLFPNLFLDKIRLGWALFAKTSVSERNRLCQ